MNIFVRSPFWAENTLASGTPLSVKLEITIAGTLRYTLIKNNDTLFAAFEIAELLRDYLEIEYSDTSTHSVAISYVFKWYDGLGGTGTLINTSKTTNAFIWDAYGYFEEGRNPTTTKGYLQSNNIIYRLNDSDVRFAVDRENTTSVTFLNNGEIVDSETITPSATENIYYVTTNSTPVSYDSFKDRVESDGGTFEDNSCLDRFLKQFDINEVDEVYIDGTDGVINVKIKTIEECKYQPIKLTFINRYGAEQDVWFFKKSVESINVSKENFKRFDISSSGVYDTTKHVNQVYNVESEKSLRINTGYVDESYNEVMKELMQSEQVWIDIDSQVLPVNVDTNSLTFKTSLNDKLVEYGIDVKYAYNEINNIR